MTTHYIDQPPIPGARELWVPIEPQPNEYLRGVYSLPRIVGIPHSELASYLMSGRDRDVTCPYKPGDVLAIREEWYCDLQDVIDGERQATPADDESFYYREDGTCCEQIPECCCHEAGKPAWRSSSTLPDWAIRDRRRVVSCRAMRPVDASDSDGLHAGYDAVVESGEPFAWLVRTLTDRHNLPETAWYWVIEAEPIEEPATCDHYRWRDAPDHTGEWMWKDPSTPEQPLAKFGFFTMAHMDYASKVNKPGRRWIPVPEDTESSE